MSCIAGLAFALGWAIVSLLDRGFQRKWRWLWLAVGQDYSVMPRAYRVALVLFPQERGHDLFGTIVEGFRLRFWFQLPVIERPRWRVTIGDGFGR